MNSHTVSQHDWDFNNGDVSSGNGFINSHTLSQFDDSTTFQDMDEYVEEYNVSGGNGSINSHNIYQ